MASGATLLILPASHLSMAAVGVSSAHLTSRNGHALVEYATGDFGYWEGLTMPRAYTGGGITIAIHWVTATATSGNCSWLTAIERMTTDLDSDSFASDSSIGSPAAANGTSGIETVTVTTHADGAAMDSVAVGDLFRLRLNRTATSDTVSGLVQVAAIEIRET